MFGIDPGSNVAGIAFTECTPKSFKVIKHYLTINRDGNWIERTMHVVENFIRCINNDLEQYSPDKTKYNEVIAIEEPMIPRFDRIGAASIQNRFIGVLLGKLYPFKSSIYLINPRSMKKIFTGSGGASKDDVINKALRYYNHSHRTKPGKECIADAIGIAYSCWAHLLDPNIKGVNKLV